MAAQPPGLRLEPLWPDWTPAGWLAGTPELMWHNGNWSTSVLLYYRAGEAESIASSERGQWVLHLECRAPSEHEGEDEVMVWFGPFGSPAAVVRIGRDGGVSARPVGRHSEEVPVRGAHVARLPERWVAQVPVPDRFIKPGGEMLIGLVRTDGRGARTTWPRPMLPWQQEPGRLIVDTRAWGEIVESEREGR
jgi:hypothetical protein